MIYFPRKHAETEGTDANPASVPSLILASCKNRAKMTENKDGRERKKTGGGLSTTKLLAAAFAAITASLITTRLTSYVGSVLIVGVTSILIAVFSEVYTRVIRKTKRFGAKIAYNAVPYEKVLPDTLAARIDEKLIDVMSTTTAMPPIKPLGGSVSADHGEHDESSASDGKTPQKGVFANMDANAGMVAATRFEDDGLIHLVQSMNEANPVEPPAPETTSDADAHADADGTDINETTADGGGASDDRAETAESHAAETASVEAISAPADSENRHANGWERLKTMFTLNSMTKGALLFLAIAMTTSAMSWVITTYVDKPSVTNVTNVTEQRVQKLSDDEKNAIKQQVKAEVSSQIAQAQKSASNASDSANDMSRRIDSLEAKLKDLETANSNARQSGSDTSQSQSQHGSGADNADIEGIRSELASLKSQLALLQDRISQIESNQQSPGGTPNGGQNTQSPSQ